MKSYNITLAGLKATSVSVVLVLTQSMTLVTSCSLTLKPSQFLSACSRSILMEYGNESTLGSLSALRL